MNKMQVEWAKTHDWYFCAVRADGTEEWKVLAHETLDDSTGDVVDELREFTDFQALRTWAGY